MTQPGVYVEGLAELRRDLRKLEDVEKLKEVREALKKGAGLVADDAKRRVPTRSGRAAGSIRATAGGNTAYVNGGKKTVPYYGWLDFGSRTPRRGNPRSVGPWTASGAGPKKGRFIYPAIDAKFQEVTRFVGNALDEVAQRLDLQ